MHYITSKTSLSIEDVFYLTTGMPLIGLPIKFWNSENVYIKLETV